MEPTCWTIPFGDMKIPEIVSQKNVLFFGTQLELSESEPLSWNDSHSYSDEV